MATNIPSVNSANTLSLFFRPGEDKRTFNTSSDSIFTFGDFKIYRDNTPDALTGTPLNLHFDSFSTLDSLGVNVFEPPKSTSVNYNELTFPLNDPFSYSYFGSFYTEVANSINNIGQNFPYAILSVTGTSAVTIYNYEDYINNITGVKYSIFRIPYATLINQGNIILNSGSSISGVANLVDNYTGFSIQMMDGSPASGNTYDIIGYNFSAGVDSYLEITINNVIENLSGTSTYFPVYIRPTKQRLAQYKMDISKLEYNLLYGGKFLIPNMDDSSETEQTFEWPTTIDGFSPDSYGTAFETYKTNLLKAASDVDEVKTNMIFKTVIPDNFLDMDSENAVYRKTVQAYAHEFDQIKHFIDGIAFAHSLEYNGENSVPKKFMNKLSNLLGWKLSDSFNEIDLFEYLAGDADGEGNSYSQFNTEIWRRILININWLYKKKGTRDALTFLFKLLGAPDCLVEFEEFVYKIGHVNLTGSTKVNEHGYINYDSSTFAFQEGGPGRGNGQSYVNQWRPEFDPQKQIDNIKSVVGDTSVFGSEDIINSKELNISVNPAKGIECDVFSFYQLSGTCGTPGSGNTVPIEYIVDCDIVKPDNISGMTLNQWLDYVYANSIDPRDRKVIGAPHTSNTYPKLRNAYLNYYYWSQPNSSKLTFLKLQGFLDVIGKSFMDYAVQLLPATTIMSSQARTLRNTVFNRQKFVYKEGLNKGSEFRTKFLDLNDSLNLVDVNGNINEYLNSGLVITTISGNINQGQSGNIGIFNISMTVNSNLNTQINTFNVSGTIDPLASSTIIVSPPNTI